jgi:hypothetical protein
MTTRTFATALTLTASLVLAVSSPVAYGRARDGATATPGTPQVFQQKTLAGQAAGSGATPQELTALDYFQIQQLVAKYARFIDTCSNNGYDYADLYTSDGVFAADRNGKILPGAQGREQLAAISGGGSRGCKNVGWIRQGVRHLYVNHVITPTAEGATGTVDMLMIGLGGDPNKIEHDGYYEDTYVKTAQGWRFKQRVHHSTMAPGGQAAPAPQSAAPAAPAGAATQR